MQDQIAVEELERGRFLCGRLIAAGGEALSRGVSRALRSMERSGMMRCTPGTVTHTAFATVPDQRCTASLSLALHRIRDTADLILEAVAALLRPCEREPL